MGDHDQWIESTKEALHARMRRVRPSKQVQQSTLLANQHLTDCESILLLSSEEVNAEKSLQTEQQTKEIFRVQCEIAAEHEFEHPSKFILQGE